MNEQGHEQPTADAAETLAGVQAATPGPTCGCGCGLILTGRQKRFASRLCSSRTWDQQHPRVNPPMLPREGRLIDAILGFLAAHVGEWFTAHQIAEAVRAFPHSVSARLSELRRKGHAIESDGKVGNSHRAHRFRLTA